jgi:hypothetical protein
MTRLRKLWKPALAILALLITAQVGASLLLRTRRAHDFLVAQLERSFGRSVEVAHFDVLLLPRPQLDADRVTIGEDPAFGSEYFLRAERLSAGLRWTGLLRGHFEFGTLSLVRPSLILVRNSEEKWNLERWLPLPKYRAVNNARFYGPPSAASPANRLQKIDFDDGRINFKILDEKLAFAFTGVSGSVNQVSPGRWQLSLEAQPWRSGVTLQSSGTVMVRGDIAGTSARLQPAEIQIHWEKVSLADLFRLFRDHDYGVRGVFALDATARSGGAEYGQASDAQPGDWTYSLQARATQIHRWDLTERADNPRVNVNLKGRWNILAGNMRADQLFVETPKSNLQGNAHFSNSAGPVGEVRFDSAGIHAADLLSWFRAFHPGVNDGITADQFFTGAVTVRGWPLDFEHVVFSSKGGSVQVPGLNAPLRIGPVNGERDHGQLVVEPVKISFGEQHRTALPAAADSLSAKRRPGAESRGSIDIALRHDFAKHAGNFSIEGHIDKTEDVLRVLSQVGYPLNRGWQLAGAASAALRWEWANPASRGRWNGRVDVTKADLQVAGLNQPVRMNVARLDWKDGIRTVQIGDAEGFGASWSGSLRHDPEPAEAQGTNTKWNFQLHADHLDAAELDRWVGPRARPNWLRRLSESLLGGAAPNPAASELLRRVNAEGELRVDEFTVQKLKLSNLSARSSLHDLRLDVRNAEAQWAGGKVRGNVLAVFLPRPSYEISADLEGVNLAQLPPGILIAERLGGSASATLHFTAQGVGREELLQKLAGKGDVKLRNVEFRGWDVSASVADGEPRTGASRWAAGEGVFAIRDRGIVLAGLRLEDDRESTLVKGVVSFEQNANLTIQTTSDAQRASHKLGGGHIIKISGPLDLPQVSIESAIAREPAD